MSRKPGGWPNYELWALEDAQACLLEIERCAKEAQELIRAGRVLEAVIVLGDVRSKAADGRLILGKGRNGER